MATKPFIAEKGFMTQVLGSVVTLAIAAPIADGSRDEAGLTASSRMGWYFDRTASNQKIGTVVEGSEILSVGYIGDIPTVSTSGTASVICSSTASSSDDLYGLATQVTASGAGYVGAVYGASTAATKVGSASGDIYGLAASSYTLATGGIVDSLVGGTFSAFASTQTQNITGITATAASAASHANALAAADMSGAIFTASYSDQYNTNATAIASIVGTKVIVRADMTQASAALTIPEVDGLWIAPGPFTCGNGGSTVVTNYYGLRLDVPSITGSVSFTNNYGVYQADGAAKNIFAGRTETSASTSSRAGLRVAPGVAPTTPVNGDIWATTSSLFAHINGTTHDLLAGGGGGTITGSGTAGQAAFWSDSTALTGDASFTFNSTTKVLGARYFQFDPLPAAPTETAGLVYWNDADNTLNVVTGVDGTVLQVGQEQVFKAVNQTLAVIADGTPVYVSGCQGQRPIVTPADADLAGADVTIGLTTSQFAAPNNSEGFVTQHGLVRGINTNAWAPGTLLYLSQTTGQMTSTPPTKPTHKVRLGYVVNQGVNGSVLVDVDVGSTLSEQHDVIITSPVAGHVLRHNGTLWVNAALASSDVSGLTAWATKAYPADSAGYLKNDGAGVLSWATGVALLTDAVILSPGSGTRNLVIPQGNYPGLTVRASAAMTNPLATWENEAAQVVTQINSDGTFTTTSAANIQALRVGCATNGDTSTTVCGNTANGRSQDVAVGVNALAGSTASGCSNNVAVGYNSQPAGGASCANNTSVGSSTLASLAAGGARNTVVGAFSGASITTGTGNVCLGYYAGRYAASSDELYVTNRDHTNTTNEKIQALLYGNFNTTITSAFLRVNGRLRVNLSANSTDNSGTGVPSGQSFVFYGASQVNAGASAFLDTFSGSGLGCEFGGRSSRGSAASPTATQADDALCRLTAYGRGASAFSTAYRAGVVMRAAEIWTATAQGTRVDIETTAPGGVATSAKVRVWGDGGVQIGTSFSASPGASALKVDSTTASTSTTTGSFVTGGGIGAGGAIYAGAASSLDTVLIGKGTAGDTNSIRIGVGSGATTSDVSIGYQSMAGTRVGGSENVALGYQSLFAQTNGSSNVAIGAQAARSHTTGGTNTYLGAYAGYTNTTGSGNVAIGFSAGRYNTASDNLYIDNRDRSNSNNSRYQGLIWGGFAASVANQFMLLNGQLQVNLTGAALANVAAVTDAVAHFRAADNSSTGVLLDTVGTTAGSEFAGRYARAGVTALLDGDMVCRFVGYGSNGASSYTSSYRGGLAIVATETWSGSNNGAALDFLVTAKATTTTERRMRLHSSGGIALGSSAQCLSDPGSSGLYTAGARIKGVNSVVTAAGTTNMAATDHVVVFTGSQTQTYALAASSSTIPGRELFLKNRSSASVTITRNGSDTIDGGASYTLTAGTAILLVLNSTDWCVF